MFRKLRDNYVKNLKNGDKLIFAYYEIAPKVIHKLNKDNTSKKLLKELYLKIKEIVSYIEKDEYEKAMKISLHEFCKLLEIYGLNEEKKKFQDILAMIEGRC